VDVRNWSSVIVGADPARKLAGGELSVLVFIRVKNEGVNAARAAPTDMSWICG
jgi:hypothetical protein